MTVDTLYPFSDSLEATIVAEKPFTYYVRIPSWTSKGTVQINSAAKKSVSPSNGLQAISVGAGTTRITLNLPADITIGLSSMIAFTPCAHISNRVASSWFDSGASRSFALRIRYRSEPEDVTEEQSTASRRRLGVRCDCRLAVRHRSIHASFQCCIPCGWEASKSSV